MNFYFSGIDGAKTYALLEMAGVRHVPVDQFDARQLPRGRPGTMLHSGAYRARKKNWTLDLAFYADIARSFAPFDRVATLDVFGYNQATFEYWVRSRCDHGLIGMPVWFLSGRAGDEKLLHRDRLSQAVAIGGLVPIMRDKDDAMLAELDRLCSLYPQRFHLFGLNWLHALEILRDKISSADSSKWLDGARYRHLITYDRGTGGLAQTRSTLPREELCVRNAMNIEAFTPGLPEPHPAEQRPRWNENPNTRRYVIDRNRKFRR